MSDWAVGYVLGIATGLGIGLVSARRQQPWSEFGGTEKRIRIGLIGITVT